MTVPRDPTGGTAPPPGLTIERFSELVGEIYECALTPELWPAALARICEAVGGPAGWIAVHQPQLVQSVYEIEAGTDPAWQRRLREEFVALSPFIGITHHVRAGEVWSFGDAIDYDEFLQGRFYRECWAPQGWGDTIMGVLSKAPGRFNWLGVNLAARAEPDQKARVAGFLPHVARGLRISQLLEFRAAQADELVAAVASLATGMALVDAGLRVRGANPAAERLIRESGALSLHDGRLLAAGDAGARLAEALAACAAARLERAGVSLILPARDGGVGLLVQVVPLARPRTGRAGDAVAAIFLSAPAEPGVAPMEAFVRRFSLTPSETRVLLALLKGQAPRAIADASGLGMPTIRTHLSRLYGKTGSAGRAELVRLASGLAAIAAP